MKKKITIQKKRVSLTKKPAPRVNPRDLFA